MQPLEAGSDSDGSSDNDESEPEVEAEVATGVMTACQVRKDLSLLNECLSPPPPPSVQQPPPTKKNQDKPVPPPLVETASTTYGYDPVILHKESPRVTWFIRAGGSSPAMIRPFQNMEGEGLGNVVMCGDVR